MTLFLRWWQNVKVLEGPVRTCITEVMCDEGKCTCECIRACGTKRGVWKKERVDRVQELGKV
jgi:hypothetical protein